MDDPVPHGGMSSWCLVAPLAFAFGCHGRTDSEPVPSPSGESAMLMGEARAHTIGELAVAPDYTMSMDSDKECPLDSPFPTKRGFVKFGIEVSFEGTSAVEVPINPFYAMLFDAGGDVYTTTLAGCDPGLKSIRITTGKKARGFITFEIPVSARKLELHYAPTIIGRGPEEVKFTVMR